MEGKSLKRKISHSQTSSKRFRDSGIESETFLETPSCFSSAGTIKKITLKNFMCHNYLEIAFPSSINFITGRNGTGKSAILTALVVGLGGRASDTNRGYSLKEFIKTDETSAMIKIVINNEGFNAFQPEKYGKEITVQRTLSSSAGSQYKISSENGNVISTKHDELQRLLLALNLQVDNPVAILTQDTARNFLHNTKAEDKYLFFLKATRLEHIESIYRRVQQSITASHETQAHRLKVLESYKNKKKEFAKRLKNLRSVEDTRDRLEVAQNELYWAHVRHEENVLEEKEAAVKEQEKLISDVNADISKQEEKGMKFKEEKSMLEGKSQHIKQEIHAMETRCTELKRAGEVMNNKCRDKAEEIDAKNEEIEKIQSNMESLSSQISKMEEMKSREGPKDKESLEKQIAELKKEEVELTAHMKTQTHHLNQLQLALTHDSRSVSSLDEELRTMKAKINKTKSRLMSLDGQEDNLLRLFGDYTVVLNKAIKQAYEKRMFSQMPIGPIGSYIKVKDRSWAPAVESIIGGDLLRSYYVNSHEDRKVLYELMKKIMKSVKSYPSVTASKFTHTVYDYRENAVQSSGHSSVLDMLEVKDPLVINYLIDLVGIESILLVENPKEAREMMKEARRVPKNCRRVVMKNGDTLYPDPNYRIYSGDDRKEAKFLQVSVDEAKRRLMAEIADCNKWAANTVTQKAEVAKQIEKHMAEIAQVKETLSRMSSKKLAISSTLKELQQTVIDASDNLQFWVEERDSLKPSLETAKEELAVLMSNYNDFKRAYKNVMEDYNKQKDALRRKTGLIDGAVSETNQYDSKINQINSALKNLARKRVEYTRNLEELVKQVDAQKEVVMKRTADALLLGPRINTKRSVASINDEILDLKNKILSVEKSEGNPQEIGEKYTAAKEKCDMLEEKILALDECIKKLKVMLKHRREVYSNCLTSLVTRVKLVFQTLITRRRFQGFIVVDHKAKTLDIKIALRDPPPKSGNTALKTGLKRGGGPDSDPKSLSGGERSFSTVAYIIALWEAVELPFYALDEFDVFMDNINREWTLGLLTGHAKEKKECQFVFLTPQSLGSLVEDEDITIFSLKPHEAQINAVY